MDAVANTSANAVRGRWAVAAFFLINGFMIGSWAPHIPLVLARLAINEFTLGLLILCFGIGALISMPWCGWLMARFGQTPVLRTVGVVQGFGLLLVILSPTVAVTAVTMMVFGSLVGCTDVAMNAATVTVERRLGRAVMSSMHGFWSLGGFAGGGLGGFMVQSYGPLAHAMVVTVLAVVAGLAAVPNLLKTEQTAPGRVASSPGKGGLPRTPTVYLLGLMALLLFATEGAVLDWGALYLKQERGADIAVAGLAYAFFSGAMATVRFLGDGVRDRFGAVMTMRASSLIAIVGMLMAGLSPYAWLAIAAFAVCGLGIANMVPIAFSAAGNQKGMSSGAGMSVVTTMGYSGILMAPSVIGFIGGHTGFAPVFVALSGLLIVVFLMAGLTRTADFPTSQLDP